MAPPQPPTAAQLRAAAPVEPAFDPPDFDPVAFDAPDFDEVDFDPVAFDAPDFDEVDFDRADLVGAAFALVARLTALVAVCPALAVRVVLDFTPAASAVGGPVLASVLAGALRGADRRAVTGAPIDAVRWTMVMPTRPALAPKPVRPSTARPAECETVAPPIRMPAAAVATAARPVAAGDIAGDAGSSRSGPSQQETERGRRAAGPRIPPAAAKAKGGEHAAGGRGKGGELVGIHGSPC